MKNMKNFSEFNESWTDFFKKEKDPLSKAVDKLIKNLSNDDNSSYVDNVFSFYKHQKRVAMGIFYSTIFLDRPELTKKILDFLPDKRAKEAVNTVYDSRGYPAEFSRDFQRVTKGGYKHPMDIAKSDKMRMLLIKYLSKEEIKKMFTRKDSFDVMKTINQ